MYKNRMNGWMKHLDFIILDILCLELSFVIAYTLRNGFPRTGMAQLYENMALAIIMIDICVVFFLGSYENIIRRGYLIELKQVITHNCAMTMGIVLWMFLIKESSFFSRAVVLSMCPISICIMIVARLVWKRIIRNRIKDNKELRKVLVITTPERLKETMNGVVQPYQEYEVTAAAVYGGSTMIGQKVRNIPIVADEDGIIPYIQNNVVDEVFIDLKGHEEVEDRFMNLFVNMGITAHLNLARHGTALENQMIHTFGNFTVMSASMRFAPARQMVVKRLMDICGALVGLLITGIAYIICAPIIKKQSPGPVFFSQERVGRNGRVFKIYKFRSMYMDAEERKKELMGENKMNGLMFKMDNDPRIIPVGHFLRKYSIDELPQFWNVLKGDMSLVGTRPPTLDEYKQYETTHRKRLAIKPGITGMWQVSGRSNIVDFEEIVALDAKYITEWSIRTDIKILWKTVMVVFQGDGAV